MKKILAITLSLNQKQRTKDILLARFVSRNLTACRTMGEIQRSGKDLLFSIDLKSTLAYIISIKSNEFGEQYEKDFMFTAQRNAFAVTRGLCKKQCDQSRKF